MYLTSEAIDSSRLVLETRRPGDGATVLFEGAVRDNHRGRRVESILYEAYEAMAEKEIARVIESVTSRWGEVNVAVRHRLGRLDVGDVSVVIVCCSPHRGEAFDACRATIDGIKQTVPIWKKERGPDGDEWVGWQWS